MIDELTDNYSARFSRIFENTDAIAVQGYNQDRVIIYWNPASEKLFGYSQSEALGKKAEELIILPQNRQHFIDTANQAFQSGESIKSSALTLCDKYGKNIKVYSSHVNHLDANGQAQIFSMSIDLTQIKEAQIISHKKELILESVFESSPDLYFLMQDDGTVIDYRAKKSSDLYVSPDMFLGKKMQKVLPEELGKLFTQKMEEVKKSDSGFCSYDYQLNLSEGLRYFESRLSYIAEYQQIVAVVRDITTRKIDEEKILHQAHYDSLTDLPNRFLALDRLSQMINDAKRNHKQVAVIFLDLDDFKKVNDSLGHESGDKLLIEAAQRLTRTIRQEDTVARLGGDEFIILLSGIKNASDARPIVENILSQLRKPFNIDDRELILTVSIGISIYPDDGEMPSHLLRNADSAMYYAKDLGRNTYSYFTQAMNKEISRRLLLEEHIHGALDRNEFEVFYQPQFDLTKREIIGVEALLRWNNRHLGSVSPIEFIPLAEQTGLIIQLGLFVINQALSAYQLWREKLKLNIRIAVNLSPRQFRDPDLVKKIKQALIDSNVAPNQLELEITEGVLMSGHTYIEKALFELSNIGVNIAMDDFGTGYSSLSYLRKYPFNVLKIDRSFIGEISNSKADKELVNAAILMAHALNIKVIAEGIETEEQFDILGSLQCDVGQGYLVSQPVSLQNIEKILTNKIVLK